MNNLHIDIETLPTDNEIVQQQIQNNLKPPGTMSKPETIQKWMENPENLKKAISKTGLDGLFGQIACMGVAGDTGDVTILKGAEVEILTDFLKIARTDLPQNAGHKQLNLVGHNIAKFDLPFINKRMLVHGMGPLFPFHAKKWDAAMSDTMQMFCGGTHDYVKLVDLCLALGVEKPLDEIDGSGVADAWAAGEQDKVFKHCESDVIATRSCYLHMTGFGKSETNVVAA